ncbi:putative linoleate diol synthase with cytochrome P450 domain [Echria macrotheca]|uniref:Linoleate diol synthase with cytochrome P450 domain n=1 Tax=Echria macrotheca TaxID=438768 RepID=A0AAJ0BFL9_9PEZI|nr:putative linoleate diol synthase with cytochrome P450 domain [Echria macrotheca]
MATYTNGTNGTNGASAVNGKSSASSTTASAIDSGERLASHAKPKPTAFQVKSTKATREGIENTFEQYGQVIRATVAPGPHQGGIGTASKKWGKRFDDIRALRGADFKTLIGVLKAKIKGEQVSDDKTMIMEHVIQLVSNLRSDSRIREELTNTFIGELWNSLDHPPLLYAGQKYEYRQADGSNNNPMFPSLGAAGSTYARSVNSTVIRQGALPDPNLIYDSVMKRTEYKKHPNNVSSILWNWAAIIIHDLFWTDYPDMTKSKTSSYLDLSPLYGSNQKMQDTIRTFKDGKLKPDCFADKRILGMPPGVGVILIMFNRFHNHVCENLIAINEDGRFSPPDPKNDRRLHDEKALAAAWKKYDNDLFQTARLVTSGLYINITLVDYVRNIINLNRVDTQWTLDPRQNTGVEAGTKKGVERGTGNAVSVEFNLCYRWHSCISERDDKWIEDFYRELFKKPASTVTIEDLVKGFAVFESQIPEDPLHRDFNKFKRGPDGKYSDDELAECITSVIEDCAGSFGARNVPQSMRAVEILGIIQGRKWNCAGLNEFRRHFGLKPYETFEDINSDPEVAGSLRRLYDHPDFVELYPGLVAEEHKKPMVPGVGIAPTYTISRVVLSDAVCLVRGDRHYTIDYTARNLTNWGYNEVQYDLNINHGCVFYKLFIRALPNHFKNNSVYAHYPMVIPSETEKILRDLKRAHLFDFTRPTRIRGPRVVSSYTGAKSVVDNYDTYRSTWYGALQRLVSEGNDKFKLSGDVAHHDSQRLSAQQELYSDSHDQIKAFYQKTTERLLAESSYNLAGKRFVDVVRDVGNLVPVHFAARVFNLPLKTKDNPKGIYTAHELYSVLSILFVAIFTHPDPVRAFPINQAAKTVAGQLGSVIESGIKSSGGFYSSASKKSEPVSAYGAKLVKGLSKAGKDVAWTQILPTVVALVPTQGELFARAVDYYLQHGKGHVAELHALANEPSSEETDALLLGYALEGLRLSGASGSYHEASAAHVIPDGEGREVSVQPGDRVYVDYKHACKEGTHFPEPSTVNPRRPVESYLHFNAGSAHAFLGPQLGQVALTEMFRAVFRRKGLHHAPGPQGQLKKVVHKDGQTEYMREDWGMFTPFPVTMKVTWDD